MGTFVFKWDHPAEEVFVTGTFDNWTKSIKLDRAGDGFEKEVELAPTGEKIYYKFVVDNEWVTSSSAPHEVDSTNNVNNVLLPDQLKPNIENVIMSNVSPQATTVGLAGAVPLENKKEEETAPTTVDATPSDVDVPGGFPETPAATAELDNPVSVNPLPAAIGAVNPIDLKPGEPLPPAAASDNIHEHVKLDKESYEKADALPGLSGLPPVAGAMIPESSLPIQTTLVSGIHPDATTVQMAGEVPLEPKVPDVVKESQDQAGVDPEASAVPKEVSGKAALEHELLEKVAPAPATSEGTAGVGTEKTEGSSTTGGVSAAAATVGGAVLASAVVAKDTIAAQVEPVVEQIKGHLPDSVKAVVGGQSAAIDEQKREEVSPEVPVEVKESIVESDKSPEAAANTQAVEAKKEVESELLEAVPKAKAAEETPNPGAVATDVSQEAPKLPEAGEAVSASSAPPAVVATAPQEPSPAEPAAVETAPQPVAEASTAAEEPPSQATAVGDEEAPPKPVEASQPSAAAAETKAEGSQGSGSEKKKKHRFSTFFSKIKDRFTSSHHDSSPKETTA